MSDNRKIVIPEMVLQKVMDYLGERPAKESMGLILSIQNSTSYYVEPEKTKTTVEDTSKKNDAIIEEVEPGN